MLNLKIALERLKRKTCPQDLGQNEDIFIVPHSKCLTCNDVKFVYKGGIDRLHPDFGKCYPCPTCYKDTFEQERLKNLMRYCSMPDKDNTLTFDRFDKQKSPETYEAILQLIAGEIRFLTLIGDVNKGKTHLGCATCHAYIDVGIPAKYVCVPDMLDELRDTYQEDAVYKYNDVMNRFKTVPLLCLDDLYAQKQSDWGSEKIYQIINARYMAQKATIITTNKSFEEIRQIDKSQGERITSRLERESWCKVVIL